MRGLVVLGLLALTSPACAEQLIAALSSDNIGVTSSFTGTSLTLFSVIQPDAQSVSRRGSYDAVVVVQGPARTHITQRKERFFGFWVNGASRAYVAAPIYYAALANRPFAEAVQDGVLSEEQIGLNEIRFTPIGRLRAPDDELAFREAFLDSKREQKLYVEDAKAVEFLAPIVFRARIPLPANVPIGEYNVNVLLMSDGAVVARAFARFVVEKEGFEASVYRSSREQPWIYGIGTIALALFMGWLAGAMFRRN